MGNDESLFPSGNWFVVVLELLLANHSIINCLIHSISGLRDKQYHKWVSQSKFTYIQVPQLQANKIPIDTHSLGSQKRLLIKDHWFYSLEKLRQIISFFHTIHSLLYSWELNKSENKEITMTKKLQDEQTKSW